MWSCLCWPHAGRQAGRGDQKSLVPTSWPATLMLFVWPWICFPFEKERGKLNRLSFFPILKCCDPLGQCVSFTALVKVLAKGKAVPKAALGTTGRAALVTKQSSGGGSWEEQTSRAELPSTWGEGRTESPPPCCLC